MPGASVATLLLSPVASTPTLRKASLVPERKYKCQFCNRGFSRSEHRSRHERSHTKERPFKCMKCRSTFVRRDLLLRHDRTVHAKDGGIPLHSDGKRRAGTKTRALAKSSLTLDASVMEHKEPGSDGVFDIEAAAMLVADLHNQASSAFLRSAGPYQTNPSAALSLHDSVNGSLLGRSATTSLGSYSSPTVAMPHIQLESFLARAQSEPKAHSIASLSSASSFDSRLSLDGTTSMHQSFSDSGFSLKPALICPLPSAPPSSLGTPRLLSPPLIGMDESAVQSPGDALALNLVPYSRSPSMSTPTSTASFLWETIQPPQVTGDEERNIILDNVRGGDCERAIPEGFRLPSLSSLNRFLSTYFGLFHHHFPFLHPISFSPTTVSPALLLAVLSIGALYAFDQDQAYVLHIGSKVLVNQFLQNKESFSSRRCPLWTMQSSLLNMIFASWSGDPKGLEWACSIKSLLANMVAGNRYELKLRQEARDDNLPTRAEWIEDEGCRRTYYAVYIFFGLLTLTYNHTPALGFNEFEDLQLPSSEDLWNFPVSDESSWQERRAASPALTFMEAHSNLFQGEPLGYSAFATRVMINALFLEVWYHKRSPEALQDVVTEYKLRLALETWDRSLELCEAEGMAVPLSAPHKGQHPLIFNARAIYRNARARLEVDLKAVQEALRYHDPYEVAAAMSNARDRVKRSAEMIKVIEECYRCIETAVLQGVRWVARTSPTNWSVEHPLCGMDLMIVLSLWLYRLEHDEEPATEEETIMYNRFRILLSQDHDQICESQLSSVIARLWESMLDEVVVWGITRLLGESFRLHAQALVGYLDDVDISSTISTSTASSQEAAEDCVS